MLLPVSLLSGIVVCVLITVLTAVQRGCHLSLFEL